MEGKEEVVKKTTLFIDVFDSLLKVEVNSFEVLHIQMRENKDDFPLVLHRMNFSRLRTLSKHAAKVVINALIGNITADDVCSIRKMMLNGACKMKTLSFFVDAGEVGTPFLEECFGVEIEENWSPRNRIYRSSNSALELYTRNPSIECDLIKYEQSLETTVHRPKYGRMCSPVQEISFHLLDESKVLEKKKSKLRVVKFDHPY
ncbi:hypothetical protein PFISCL1PPCAC_19177 [Pristionchus fissidentatus]|uniref:Uncharacterized protein n=1 Tax=Pristionchus fissidentatus TaxID=1538716 RepID=A0AAV5WB64_9BILA|nr:hypothetical protein PFISCL1PPCAC_19177 [Pristionchus fissidentatus]